MAHSSSMVQAAGNIVFASLTSLLWSRGVAVQPPLRTIANIYVNEHHCPQVNELCKIIRSIDDCTFESSSSMAHSSSMVHAAGNAVFASLTSLLWSRGVHHGA
eukprot:TRINITY_DN3259_c0_g1_i1.p2 TRINITY_DN3259_c0_g1~~TRINITY_DN3259_c0_g1_i1.p2  ORF type:complete len:103 (+),score=6.55 TRINITY_DN3259_c0_g1_i1:774-1082(+)